MPGSDAIDKAERERLFNQRIEEAGKKAVPDTNILMISDRQLLVSEIFKGVSSFIKRISNGGDDYTKLNEGLKKLRSMIGSHASHFGKGDAMDSIKRTSEAARENLSELRAFASCSHVHYSTRAKKGFARLSDNIEHMGLLVERLDKKLGEMPIAMDFQKIREFSSVMGISTQVKSVRNEMHRLLNTLQKASLQEGAVKSL